MEPAKIEPSAVNAAASESFARLHGQSVPAGGRDLAKTVCDFSINRDRHRRSFRRESAGDRRRSIVIKASRRVKTIQKPGRMREASRRPRRGGKLEGRIARFFRRRSVARQG